ncbi:MAG: hypothetical protein ACRDG3_00395, partial [Tepidiformaceae bacterium]
LAPGAEGADDRVPRVRSEGGTVASLKTPEAAAALQRLTAMWPRAERLDDLLADVAQQLGGAAHDEVAARVASVLLTLYRAKLVEFRSEPAECIGAADAGERPVAFEVARLQARRGTLVANTRHEAVRLDRACEVLAPAIDGTRTRAELAEIMAQALETGTEEAAAPTDSTLAGGVEAVIRQLGVMSLLTG